MKRFFMLCGLAGGLCAGVASLGAQAVRIVGSDLVADSLGSSLGSFAAANDVELTLDFRGSRPGIEAIKSGRADFGVMVFAPGDAKPEGEMVAVVMGYMTTVFAVPESVALTQLHYAQLGGVFGASEQTNYKRWSELGVTGNWAVRGITAVATDRRQGLAIDLFRYGVLQTPELKPTVVLFERQADAIARISGEEGGIALLGSPPPEGTGLKVLLLAKEERDVAYGPTAENLHTGDYPLRLPVYLVFRQGEARRLNRVLRHLLADETMPALLAAGVVPLPTQARNQLVFDLETL